MKEKDCLSIENGIDLGERVCSIVFAMKSPSLFTLGGLALMLASCGSLQTLNQPLSGDGDFDPLSSPGSATRQTLSVAPTSPSYAPGQWVETSMDNATFFRVIPKGNARADQVLAAGTAMKVVSNSGTYVKVELDSGSTGYVPEIMIAERRSANEIPVTAPEVPLPDLGSVPPPFEPGIDSGEGIAPPPEIPGTPPPVPEIPGAVPPPLPSYIPPVPTVPDATPADATPTVPNDLPPVPDVAPPPEILGNDLSE